MARATTIDLLRHGEPEGGVRIRGWRDDPLSETGWQQMWSAVEGKGGWEQIVSSPMTRCRAFAEALGERLVIPVTVESRLKEVGFGSWEGADPKELRARDPASVSNFWSDPVANPPPGGEPFDDFRQRVTDAWEEIMAEQSGRHVLVVAHGGVIRMLMAYTLGMPVSNLFRMEIPFAAASRIRVEGAFPRVAFVSGCF
ncbi:MAG TPA: histidine phosphatase family protein [Sedimenticola sp.]|nr:histidine phosphatase family protein [Sedimenticola sp.]